MKGQPTSLELRFAAIWRTLGGAPLEAQFTLPGRRYRWDYADPITRILVDLQGGTFGNGWHQNVVRYDDDCEKANLAILEGWRPFHLTRRMLDRDPVGYVGPIVRLSQEVGNVR